MWLFCGAMLISAIVFSEGVHYRNGFRDRFFCGKLHSPLISIRIWGQRRSLEIMDEESVAFLNAQIAHITPHYEIALMYNAELTTADGRQVDFILYVTETKLLFQTPSNDLVFEGYPDNPPTYAVDISSAPLALTKAVEFLLTGAAKPDTGAAEPQKGHL